MIAVVAAPGGAEVRPEEIIAHCTQGLTRFAIPRYIRMMDALPPLTPSQRIEKYKLRADGSPPTPGTGRPPMSEWKRFAVERRNDGVTIITMTRPEKLNAMDQLWFAELTALMNGLGGSEQDPTRVAVLTGQGRAFSAGGDIDMFHDLAGGDVSRVRPHLRRVYDAFHAVERCAVPVIAAVNGIAYGGGTELTMACDMALAGGENARFCCKEAAVG